MPYSGTQYRVAVHPPSVSDLDDGAGLHPTDFRFDTYVFDANVGWVWVAPSMDDK
jgi:hypothetical protein